jgi:hypothetical protein
MKTEELNSSHAGNSTTDKGTRIKNTLGFIGMLVGLALLAWLMSWLFK